MGFGLSISKMIVEQLGGLISVSSEKDVGSCFKFSIQNQIPTRIDEDDIEDIIFETENEESLIQ
jgi:K+-sensing histidine kinase KdpD